MKHKCRVWKESWLRPHPWMTSCPDCKSHIHSKTWKEAVLEALHHKMRNE